MEIIAPVAPLIHSHSAINDYTDNYCNPAVKRYVTCCIWLSPLEKSSNQQNHHLLLCTAGYWRDEYLRNNRSPAHVQNTGRKKLPSSVTSALCIIFERKNVPVYIYVKGFVHTRLVYKGLSMKVQNKKFFSCNLNCVVLLMFVTFNCLLFQ